ncbi:hypothetical protein EDD16DRAFT_1702393 [Pisolithus croceorrhizus]|nr:hypothetical protein EDD16DRAFT_1702393 [Pisolithus croceorrhizus]
MLDEINPADDELNEAGPSGHESPAHNNFPGTSALTNPTGHEPAETSHPDTELDETNPLDHGGLDHYNGHATSSDSTLSSHPQTPASDAVPEADQNFLELLGFPDYKSVYSR